MLCLKVSPQQKQLISYPSGCVGDWCPQEKQKPLQWWINTFLPQQKVTNAIFDEAKVLTDAAALQLKQHVSAAFKEYCRSDSVYRLQSRPERPDQFIVSF